MNESSVVGGEAKDGVEIQTGVEHEEQVLVVPRDLLFAPGYFQGMQTDRVAPYLERITADARFLPRAAAEEDESYKQVIPYLVVIRERAGGESPDPVGCEVRSAREVFLVERFRSQGEARLHRKLSIGIGGHVNPEDCAPDPQAGSPPPWEGGRDRELREEVECRGSWVVELVGLLNDDSNPVGRVHFGLVHLVRLEPGGSVEVRERDKMRGRFVPIPEMSALSPRLETWSRIVYDQYLKLAEC